MSKIFDLAIAPAALDAALGRVARNRGGPGGDGMSVAMLQANAPALLARLHADLAEGDYRSGPLRRLAIPKRSGGVRRLAIPCVIDRVAQTAVATALTPWLERGFSQDSFAYRVGRGVRQAVARVASLRRAGYDHVVDGDIRGFFDNVPHAPLLQKLRAEIDDPRLIALIGGWLADWDLPETPGRGLAQGSPLSPLLANLYLDALDDLFENGPVRIVRFADDFLLLARSDKGARRALEQTRAHLAEYGLELHPDKTRIVPFDQRLDFLGHLFVRSVVIEDDLAEADAVLQAASAELDAAAELGAAGAGAAEQALPFAPGGLAPAEAEAGDLSAQDIPGAGLSAIRSDGSAPRDDWIAELAEGRDIADFAEGLAPLYVLDRDARLAARGECFAVEIAGRERLLAPAWDVGRIEVGKGVMLDASAIRLAADNGLPLTLLDGDGAALAELLPPTGDDRAGLHLAQARQVSDDGVRLALAGTLVEAKLRNHYALLKRLNRRRGIEKVEDACKRIKQLWHVGGCAGLNQLRAREGEAGDRGWRALGLCLEHGFRLGSRREDPANPFNALLDWLAHLLARDMTAAAARAGLHTGFGLLHETGDRRAALAWDLMEPFRAPLADGLAAYLVNNRMVRAVDFAPVAGRARMAPDAARRVLTAYENWLARPVRNPRDRRMTSWRGLMRDDARAFAAMARSGDPALFVPYRMDW